MLIQSIILSKVMLLDSVEFILNNTLQNTKARETKHF